MHSKVLVYWCIMLHHTHCCTLDDNQLFYVDSSGVRLTLKPSSEAFGIINQQLVVTNSSFLDYETRSRYGLMIVALDLEWLDSNFRGTEVTILVQDVNDNAPVVQNSG